MPTLMQIAIVDIVIFLAFIAPMILAILRLGTKVQQLEGEIHNLKRELERDRGGVSTQEDRLRLLEQNVAEMRAEIRISMRDIRDSIQELKKK